METKKWYLSKAIWAGVFGVIFAVYNALVTSLAAGCDPAIEGICVTLPLIPEWIYGALAALGIYGRGSATTRIG